MTVFVYSPAGSLLRFSTCQHARDTRNQRVSLLIHVREATQYTGDDWQNLQDGMVAALFPVLADHPELPSPVDVRTGYQQLSDRQSLSRLIIALKRAPDVHLEIIRNEAQVLAEQAARAIGHAPGLIGIDEFLRYLAVRYVNPPASQDLVQLFKALGWHRPPDPPLIRWRSSPQTTQPHPQQLSARE